MTTNAELVADTIRYIADYTGVDMDVASRMYFKITDVYRKTQERTEASGQLIVGSSWHSFNLNLSSIWSRLIKEAARVCDSYASDLLIDIQCIEESMPQFVEREEEHTWLFGFRTMGVDGNSFIEQRGACSSEYVSVWSLTLHHIEKLDDSYYFCVTLKQDR